MLTSPLQDRCLLLKPLQLLVHSLLALHVQEAFAASLLCLLGQLLETQETPWCDRDLSGASNAHVNMASCLTTKGLSKAGKDDPQRSTDELSVQPHLHFPGLSLHATAPAQPLAWPALLSAACPLQSGAASARHASQCQSHA